MECNKLPNKQDSWLLVDSQGEEEGREYCCSRRDSGSSGTSGGFVKLDELADAPVGSSLGEAEGDDKHQEQLSGLECVASVGNQLLLPVNALVESLNSADNCWFWDATFDTASDAEVSSVHNDDGLSSPGSSFDELGQKRQLSQSSIYFGDQGIAEGLDIVTSPTNESYLNAANSTISVEEILMWQDNPAVQGACLVEEEFGVAESLQNLSKSCDNLNYPVSNRAINDTLLPMLNNLYTTVSSSSLTSSSSSDSFRILSNESDVSQSWDLADENDEYDLMENDSTHVEENESLEPDSDMRTLSLPSLSESTYLDNHLLARFPKFNLPLVHSLLIAMAMILSCALGIGIGLYIGTLKEFDMRLKLSSEMSAIQSDYVSCRKQHDALIGNMTLPYNQNKLKKGFELRKQENDEIHAEIISLQKTITDLKNQRSGYKQNQFEMAGTNQIQNNSTGMDGVLCRQRLNEATTENENLRQAIGRLRYSQPCYSSNGDIIENNVNSLYANRQSDSHVGCANDSNACRTTGESSKPTVELKDSCNSLSGNSSESIDDNSGSASFSANFNFSKCLDKLSSWMQNRTLVLQELDNFDPNTLLELALCLNETEKSRPHLPHQQLAEFLYTVFQTQFGKSNANKVSGRDVKTEFGSETVQQIMDVSKKVFDSVQALFRNTANMKTVNKTLDTAKIVALSLLDRMNNVLDKVKSYSASLIEKSFLKEFNKLRKTKIMKETVKPTDSEKHFKDESNEKLKKHQKKSDFKSEKKLKCKTYDCKSKMYSKDNNIKELPGSKLSAVNLNINEDFLKSILLKYVSHKWHKPLLRAQQLFRKVSQMEEKLVIKMDNDEIDKVYENFDDLKEDLKKFIDPNSDHLHDWLSCQKCWWKSRLQRASCFENILQECEKQLMQWQINLLCKSARCQKRAYSNSLCDLCIHNIPETRSENVDSSHSYVPNQNVEEKYYTQTIVAGVDKSNWYGQRADKRQNRYWETKLTDEMFSNSKTNKADFRNEEFDWFSRRADYREFQRNKPWYYRRADDREYYHYLLNLSA